MPSGKPLRDYYKILGVGRSASHDEIRSAYHRLAKKFHPDINKSEDSEFWMQLINEAYEVLGDKRKKAMYDYIFFADSRFSSQSVPEDMDDLSEVSGHRNDGFRKSFAHFIVAIVRSEDALNIILMVLVFLAVSLYLVFGQAELAAGMIAFLFVLGSIFLMVRIAAEIFGRAGVRQEEEWFQEAFMTADYLPSHIPDPGTRATQDL